MAWGLLVGTAVSIGFEKFDHGEHTVDIRKWL